MISGATRGTGLGGKLPRHLLKAENEATVIPARGLGSPALADQIREIVAQSAGGRTDRPIYHVFCSPDPAIAENAAARARFWALFEAEFDMAGQPFCGVEHRKDGRLHEHRVYGLVRPSGGVVSLSWDYARRETCARIVEHEFGMAAVPSRHARAIAKRLQADGRHDVADWLVASGTTTSERPVARLTPRERLIGERTGLDLDDVRRASLAAWREAVDGPAFVAALRTRGLDLRQGRVGPVIVDGSGTTHLATRVIGAASRRFEGERIRAATVKAFLADLDLQGANDGSRDPAKAGGAGTVAPRDPGRPGAAGYGRVGVRRPGRDPVGPDGSRGGSDGGRAGAALARLQSASVARGAVIRRRLGGLDMALGRYQAAVERACRATERLDAIAAAKRERAWALWGVTDIWGIPLQ